MFIVEVICALEWSYSLTSEMKSYIDAGAL